MIGRSIPSGSLRAPTGVKTVLAILLMPLMAICSGCDGPPRATNLSSAISRYEAGNFEAALTDSQSALRESSGTDADRAALVASMSAYHLGRLSNATGFATRAARSPDLTVQGQAQVVLGDIALSEDSPEAAARAFDAAAAAFDRAHASADAAAARGYAERTRALIRASIAPPPTHVPANEVAAAPTAARAAPAPKGGAVARQYTIRAGSYTTLASAEKRAKALARDLTRADAPEAHIDEVDTPKGEHLFAVRIGSYSTRAEAEKVMATIARKDLMVGAIDVRR